MNVKKITIVKPFIQYNGYRGSFNQVDMQQNRRHFYF